MPERLNLGLLAERRDHPQRKPNADGSHRKNNDDRSEAPHPKALYPDML
jgi:hypothetical protein